MMAGAGHLLRPQKAQETGFLGSCDLQELIKHKTSMINYSIVMRSVNANLLEINRRQKRLDLFDADLKSASSEYIFP